MGCTCGGKKMPAKKVGAKKVPPKKVQANAHPSRASKQATRKATLKATKNNPYAKGCKCS